MMRIDFDENRRVNEANVTAELYYQMRLRGIKLILEYRFNNWIRADAVMVRDGKILAVIETKNRKYEVTSLGKKKDRKYSTWAAPLVILSNFQQVPRIVKKLLYIYNQNGYEVDPWK